MLTTAFTSQQQLKLAPPKESLTITDNRTGKEIVAPITNNSIPATTFKALKPAPALRNRH